MCGWGKGGWAAGRARLHKLAGPADAALGGMLQWSCPTDDNTKHTLVDNTVRRIITSAAVCGALFTSIAPQKTYSKSCATRRVCVQRIIDSRVIVSWNQGPAPTTANSSPFNLALFLRIESPNPIRPTILYSHLQAQSRFLCSRQLITAPASTLRCRLFFSHNVLQTVSRDCYALHLVTRTNFA